MASLGEPLDEWQENVLEAALGERADGRWAARQVGLCTPRQNGKSQLIVARALAGILLFGEELILCSAHQQDTAREVFIRLVDILERNPSVDARVDSYGKALNREYIRFRGGQTIRFKARNAGGGRGFSADCLLLDEAQILGSSAWSAILPTLSARPNPQVWLLGTPPTPVDDGEVFERFREAGLAGRDTRLAWLEWAADPQDDFDSPETWAKANPAYGVRIDHEAIAAERSTMSDDQFALERLGLWAGNFDSSVIDPTVWADLADRSSVVVDPVSFALAVSPDRAFTSIAVAGRRADGLRHVEVVDRRKGTGWAAERLAQLVGKWRTGAVLLDASGPAGALLPELAAKKVDAEPASTREMAQACGSLFDHVAQQQIRHLDQAELNLAVAAAKKRPVGDAWVWRRKNTTEDISPLEAVTLAAFGAEKQAATQRSGKAAFF